MRHLSILFRATCITSHTVLRFLPATRAEKSSANPCAEYPTELNACNRPSAISIHMSADRTPPGQVDLHIYISGVGSCYPRGQHRVNPSYNSTTDSCGGICCLGHFKKIPVMMMMMNYVQ